MIRYHDVRQLTTAELERAKRDLHANLGLITPDSPAHVPIQAHMQAIDAELAERAENPEGQRKCSRVYRNRAYGLRSAHRAEQRVRGGLESVESGPLRG